MFAIMGLATRIEKYPNILFILGRNIKTGDKVAKYKIFQVLVKMLIEEFLRSSLASSSAPSIFILREVLTRANSVGLNSTVPSSFRGIFIATRRLQATRGGHNLPNPKDN